MVTIPEKIDIPNLAENEEVSSLNLNWINSGVHYYVELFRASILECLKVVPKALREEINDDISGIIEREIDRVHLYAGTDVHMRQSDDLESLNGHGEMVLGEQMRIVTELSLKYREEIMKLLGNFEAIDRAVVFPRIIARILLAIEYVRHEISNRIMLEEVRKEELSKFPESKK